MLSEKEDDLKLSEGNKAGMVVKNLPAKAGDTGNKDCIPERGNGNPLQYSSLENSMDCLVHGVAKSWT